MSKWKKKKVGLSKRVVYFLHIKSEDRWGSRLRWWLPKHHSSRSPCPPCLGPCLRVSQSCSIPASRVRVRSTSFFLWRTSLRSHSTFPSYGQDLTIQPCSAAGEAGKGSLYPAGQMSKPPGLSSQGRAGEQLSECSWWCRPQLHPSERVGSHRSVLRAGSKACGNLYSWWAWWCLNMLVIYIRKSSNLLRVSAPLR